MKREKTDSLRSNSSMLLFLNEHFGLITCQENQDTCTMKKCVIKNSVINCNSHECFKLFTFLLIA